MSNGELHFFSLFKSVLHNSTTDISDLETILISYPLYTSNENLLLFIKKNMNPKTKYLIEKFIYLWIPIYRSKELLQFTLDILPSIKDINQRNKLKLLLLRTYTVKKKYKKKWKAVKTKSNKQSQTNSSVFIKYSISKVAQALTMIDWEVFSQVDTISIITKSWQKEDRQLLAPHLSFLADRCVVMSRWVATQILCAKDDDERIHILSTFIQLLKDLVEKRNHETALQVLCGLNLACIQRMKNLWTALPLHIKVSFEEIDELFSPAANYARYRELLSTHEAEDPPCFPYIAVFLRDVIYVFDGNPEYNNDKSLNFERLKLLSNQIKRLKQFQVKQYNYNIPPNLYKFLSKLWPVLNEEVLYQKSLQLRPNIVEFEELPKVPLETILKEPLLSNGFRKYLLQNDYSLHWHFLKDIQRFKLLKKDNGEEIDSSIARIIGLYFTESSDSFLSCVDSKIIDTILKQFTNGDGLISIFNDAYNVIYKLLIDEKLPLFYQHPLYQNSMSMMGTLEENTTSNNLSILSKPIPLSENDWEKILSIGSLITLYTNEVLLKEGDTASCIFFMATGSMRIYKDFTKNEQKVLGKVKRKYSILFKTNLFICVPSPVTYVSYSDETTVYRVDIIMLKRLFLDNPELGLSFYQHCGQKLCDSFKKIHLSASSMLVPKIRKSGHTKSINFTNPEETPFSLPATEQIISKYPCKVIYGPGISKSGSFYLTTNNICYESDYIFGKKSEIISSNSVIKYKVNSSKNQLKITYRKRSKIFILDVEHITEISKYLDLFTKNKRRRERSQRNCRIRSISSDIDEMEPSIEEWDEIIASQTKALCFNKGDVIMEVGKEYNCIWQVNSGSVRIEKQNFDTASVPIAIMGEGYLFGVLPFISGTPSLLSVIAEEEVEVYVTSKSALEELYKTQKIIVVKFYHYLCATLALRIRDTDTTKKKTNSLHYNTSKLIKVK